MDLMPNAPRLLIRVDLDVLQGTRFQPTGFPDIGAATYQLADGTDMLLVESEQSVANRLETVCWDTAGEKLVDALEGMPYVQVDDQDGEFLTSSLLEAHRLNSVYVEKTAFFKDELTPAIGHDKKKPTDLKRLARALCRFDPNSLVHGTFLESIAGTLRLPRALSGFIEARNVGVVASGGVKNDRVTPQTKDTGRSAKDGYGNVPFHRSEFTAEAITAYFKIDLALLRGYGLGEAVNRFLVALSLWKVRAFLDAGLRLRTACDLDPSHIEVTRPDGWAMPERAALEGTVRELIGDIRANDDKTFGPSPTVATYTGK